MDVAPLRSTQAAGSAEVARQIEAACREHGFFYVTGHGVAPELLARLTRACAAFFALPQAAKMEHAFSGTYSDYLLGKVSKVFPQLRREVLTDEAP